MSEYGIPYMGSKAGICDWLVRQFPRADHFYDLFGGGFSVTHAMIKNRSRDFKEFHFNEIRPGVCELIQEAIDGKYSYDHFLPEFIDRETFFAKKDSDAYVKLIWSFGNNGKDYLFSETIEPYKKSMHNAIMFNRFDSLAEKILGFKGFQDGYTVYDRRIYLRQRIEHYRKTGVPKFLHGFLSEKQLEQLERLQGLEQLERLQGLEKIEKNVKFYSSSYESVPIKTNSILYCDIPYKDTVGYDSEFSHKQFFDWTAAHTQPVFISEYDVRDPRFTLVSKIAKRPKLEMANAKTKMKIEKLYANAAGRKALFRERLARRAK